MAPGILAPEPSFTLNEMDKTAKEKHDFGAVIEDLDLNNISDADVKALADAIWTHKLVVVRGHQNLAPIKQWELVTRFDPQAPQVHSHGDLKTFHKTGGLLSVRTPTPLTCNAALLTPSSERPRNLWHPQRRKRATNRKGPPRRRPLRPQRHRHQKRHPPRMARRCPQRRGLP
ncbi:hypothetical protein PtrM4_146180 [Pyrenophora tritici-repentis]|uniref:TauD/TfdA-like domain-containing protein n=1 Tax=Pyrenophora tritici-repentis TaxID=45151 RepID=A0A834RL91_9PLEO|nr:hypothetical protein PtrM4_146180 [Pyrenophora tritici-repentis]